MEGSGKDKSDKIRIDILLVKQGLSPSRERAKELITSGKVIVDGKIVKKPSERFSENIDNVIVVSHQSGKKDKSGEIDFVGVDVNYVSRGYLKIKWAHSRLGFDVSRRICADIGCSTGGFTQFLIEMGANKVYAIDVGRGVLHYSLRGHPCVVLMEGRDAKKISENDFDQKPDFATVDVSFTSSLPVLRNIKFIPEVLVLVKPNFEVPKKYLKKGVLRDMEMVKLALLKVISGITDIYSVKAGTFSYPRGSSGNIEFFLWLIRKNYSSGESSENEHYVMMIDNLVREAFQFFSIIR